MYTCRYLCRGMSAKKDWTFVSLALGAVRSSATMGATAPARTIGSWDTGTGCDRSTNALTAYLVVLEYGQA